MTVEQDERGRYVHNFRQSWLGSVELCDERARFELVGEMPDEETDAASLGTACHAGIEQVCRDRLDYGEWGLLDDAIEVFHKQLDEQIAMPSFVYKKYDESTMRILGEEHLTNWYEQVLPTLADPLAVEWEFNVLLYEDHERVINLKGTADYLDINLHVTDWKTSSRPYKILDKQSAAIQPTVYSYAVAQEYGYTPTPQFSYVVMVHPSSRSKARIQTVTIERNAGHVLWLQRRCLTLARMIEADLPHWPQHDDGWFCSAKWCPAFALCKGAAMRGELTPA